LKLKKASTIFGLSFFILTLISCKEEKLPTIDVKSNEVQFYAVGEYNSSNLKIEAGVNNYFMNSNYYLNGRLFVLKSTLEQTNCTECPNSLEISISNFQKNSSVTAFNIDTVFYPGKVFPLFFDSLLSPINKPNLAVINVKDPLAYKYYSQVYYQPSNFLRIKKVESYPELNHLGQKTVKVSFQSNCFLKNDSLGTLDTLSLHGVFAFAYPN